MNPNIPKAQLDEERRKLRAGRHQKTDCARRREQTDPLFGLGPMIDKAFPKWLARRGFATPLGHRDLMNRQSFQRAQAAKKQAE